MSVSVAEPVAPAAAGVATLVDLLLRRAREQGAKEAFTFLTDGEAETARLTCGELDRAARAIAAQLQERGVGPGQRALLLYPAGLDFIAAFFGALYAGVVAVPAYPPRRRGVEQRLPGMAADCRPAAVLTTAAVLARRESLVAAVEELGAATWLATDRLDPTAASAWQPPALDAGTLAFLQYTSGSTGTPKGVRVSHGNLLHNEEMIRRAFGQTAASVVVGWLPLYHDMGLIGNVLQPLYVGARCVLMSPMAFLQRPARWLEAISRYRATTSGGPNFAWALCAERLGGEGAFPDGLDLRSWRVAFNGAEPVRASTQERFAAAFAPYGFRRQAFFPCYGMAETTLFVSGRQPASEPVVRRFDPAALEHGRAVAGGEEGRALVSCGQVWMGQEVAIVDPETRRRLPDGQIGEIWVCGPSVAAGYWQQPALSARVFGARRRDDASAGPYLRSGDLGFLDGGELFVTGRIKDLIILRGRNLHPQDLEHSAAGSHPALRAGGCAAFAVEVDDAERLVVVVEVERRAARELADEAAAAAVVDAVRQALAAHHEAAAHAVLLLRAGALPRTSSGKIRRHACRQAYLAGTLQRVVASRLPADRGGQPAGEREVEKEAQTEAEEELFAALRRAAARALVCPLERIDARRPLTALGLDSLAAMELAHAVEKEVGTAPAVEALLDGATLEGLCRELATTAADGSARPAAVQPVAAEGDHPLSHGQQALWFLQRLAPESAAYHIAAAARVHGALAVDDLDGALGRLVARHGALRARFPVVDGAPVQRIEAPRSEHFRLQIEEASAWSDQRVDDFLAAAAHQPFDLARGPLLRVIVLRRAPDVHLLLLVVHHIVADFWSLAILLDELDGMLRQASPPLPAVGLTYPAWVRAEGARLAGAEGERLAAFWRRELAGALPLLELVTDRPRPAVQTWKGGVERVVLEPALGDGLAALARSADTTPYTVLLAVFQTLLARLSGQQEILVGSPTAGRRGWSSQVVGYLANPVVVRGRLGDEEGGELTFSAFLARLRQTVLGVLRHRDYPFELLVERLQPERDPSRSPLFQVFFTLQQTPPGCPPGLEAFALGRRDTSIELGGLRWEPYPVAVRAAQFELGLVAAVDAGGLALALHFNADLFDPQTASRLLGQVQTLLRAVLAAPDTPLGALPLLTSAARHQLLAAGRGPRRAAEEACLHHLVRDQARRAPQAVAVVGAGRTTTYGTLWAAATALGRRLRGLGVGPEVPVGVLLERSDAMVTALLAILEAGGAWLPLDPSWPGERLRFMVEDAWRGQPVRVLLSRQQDLSSHRALGAAASRVVFLDEPAVESPTAPDAASSTPAAGPDNLAYVIYTSGSTGRPKGVAIPHRAAVNFLRAMAAAPGLGPEDALLAVTTLSFDISVLELFLPLTVGARVVVADRETVGDGQRLGRLIAARRITALQATPATWQLLVEGGWAGRPGLAMLCGGEALPSDLAAQLRPRGAALWNLYGPTETTVWSAAQPVAAGEAPVRIGGPIANTRLLVLDGRLAPLPPGVRGELWIAGDGLARGYLGRPALTAARFVPDPSPPGEGGGPGGRLYRVGDVAVAREAGTFELCGRLDHQVKVRGFRIELGEIEAVLREQPSVAQAVVVVHQVAAGDARLVAHWVAQDAAGAESTLRTALQARLPAHMVPAALLRHAALPLTPNGKIDRLALAAMAPERGTAEAAASPAATLPRGELERTIAAAWCAVLGLEAVGRDDNFFDLGGHSLLVTRLHQRLVEGLGRDDLAVVHLFQHPTVRALARFLAPGDGEAREAVAPLRSPRQQRRPANDDIAIIGMAGRFPGAASIEALWALLRAGKEGITTFSDDELAWLDPALRDDPRYVRARGVVDEAESFDAAFFGFTPREAEILDPQHRVFLECAWEALEDAGYDTARYGGRIGSFVGVGLNTYLLHAGEARLRERAGGYQAFISNDKDFVPTRVAYKLDLRGPSLNVQTACSSSLVAVHLACQSLLCGESDMALAGGVSVRVPQNQGYLYEPGGILSPDGHCRAFDAAAGGTVLGNGLGAVVLKPLAAAQEDGDHIWALIKGSAINNDGAVKMGYTAPSVAGQAAVLAAALEVAGVSPHSIGYVEAHGTGTELGDPVEVEALRQVFGGRSAAQPACALGSVKTNLGHLDTAAGVAGLIKAVLALHHRELPPSLHFQSPNPRIPLTGDPFFVNAALRPWAEGPRRAGVSSFGIGGTNAHVVLEEAPPAAGASAARPGQLVLLSARSAAALEAATERLVAHGRRLRPPLADLAFTLQTGRRAFAHRRWLVADDLDTALDALAQRDRAHLQDATAAGSPPRIAFLFSGQGSQYLGMGWGLYQSEPLFRRTVDDCAAHLAPLLGLDLRQVIAPPQATAEAADRLRQTALAQPALFVVEYALARLWMSWGVQPEALLGHSIGEWVAATLAGVFSLQDALALVVERGRQMQAQPPGGMLAVALPADAVAALLAARPSLALAAVNGPEDCVLSGPRQALAALAEELAARGVRCRTLHTSHAFHTPAMAPAAAALARAVGEVGPRPPQIPYLANRSGSWVSAEEATDAESWGRQIVEPVRFADAVATLAAESYVLLEVGPGRSLTQLVRSQARSSVCVASLPHPRDPQDDEQTVLAALGRLWQEGAEIDWPARYQGRGERRQRVSLPTYPFERRRYWLQPAPAALAGVGGQPRPSASLAKRPDPASWLYAPVWQQRLVTPQPATQDEQAASWLLFSPTLGAFTERLVAHLVASHGRLVVATAGQGMQRLATDRFVLDPRQRGQWEALFTALGEAPAQLVYAALEGGDDDPADGYASLLALVQALAGGGPTALNLLVPPLSRIVGGETVRPAGALLAGLLRAVPQEVGHLRCRTFDVEVPCDEAALADLLDDLGLQLAATADAPGGELALRRGAVWQQGFEPLPLTVPAGAPRRWRAGGVYLLTGGLGGVALALARGLASGLTADGGGGSGSGGGGPCVRLGLLSRSGAPPRERWDDGDLSPEAQRRVAALRQLEALGAEVMVLTADVADHAAMAAAIAALRQRWGAIHGVIHAAGVAGGGLLRLREAHQAAEVLAPKVRGTQVLAAVLAEEVLAEAGLASELDFVVLCSSINTVVGGWGQSDYIAANAFLDAWAVSRHARRGPRWVAVAWDRFRDLGMAASLAGGAAAHPLLGTLVSRTPERDIYRALYRPAEQWVLAEHRVAGQPTVPGATYLEMARAAWTQRTAGRPLDLHDVTFLEPLVVADGARREVLTVFDFAAAEGTDAVRTARFQVLSRGSAAAGWREHCRGKIAARDEATAGDGVADVVDLTAVRGRCPDQLTAADAGSRSSQGFLVTGRRWQALTALAVGDGELLATLELAADLGGDVDTCALHPALLDLAVGCIQLVEEGDYLPLAYGRLTPLAPLPGRLWSHLTVRRGKEDGQRGETLVCDARLCDAQGTVLVRVEGFSMRRTTAAAISGLVAAADEAPEESGAELSAIDAVLEGTIEGTQAVEVLHCLLAAERLPAQVVVSPRDLTALRAAYRAFDPDTLAAELGNLEPAAGAHARPQLETPYATPEAGMESLVAEVWQRYLGVERVGVHDNFFELGGTSLVGVQVVGELGRRLGREIPTVSLFEAPTVGALARHLAPQVAQVEAFAATRSRVRRKKAALATAPRRRARQRGGAR